MINKDNTIQRKVCRHIHKGRTSVKSALSGVKKSFLGENAKKEKRYIRLLTPKGNTSGTIKKLPAIVFSWSNTFKMGNKMNFIGSWDLESKEILSQLRKLHNFPSQSFK